MNRWMLVCAGLTGLTTLVHVFVGGPEVNAPIQGSQLDPVVRGVALVVWHMVSLMLAAMTLALCWLARGPNLPLALMVLGLQLGFALLFLGAGAVMLGSLAPMPQWTVFLAVAGLILVGLRKA